MPSPPLPNPAPQPAADPASPQPLWTLPELAAVTAADLSDLDQANGQVQSVPDLRTLRWYNTLGLLDRPLAWRGRAALYGPRHRSQVVAIKRLQAAGLSLSQIQERILGKGENDLAQLAGGALPPAPVAPSEPPPARTFWKRPEPEPVAMGSAPRPHLRVDLCAGATLDLPVAALDEAAWRSLQTTLVALTAWCSAHLPAVSHHSLHSSPLSSPHSQPQELP